MSLTTDKQLRRSTHVGFTVPHIATSTDILFKNEIQFELYVSSERIFSLEVCGLNGQYRMMCRLFFKLCLNEFMFSAKEMLES
jgi:hypothetical protein